VIASAALVTVGAALFGTWRALIDAFRLAPAEAMRPEPPHGFRRGLVERLPMLVRIDQPTRMILRNLERRPLKALLAVVGIALAVAILVTGRFQADTIDYMLAVQFGHAAREDLSVSFTEPAGRAALHELAALPGVIRAEPYRAVAVELVHGHRSYRSAIRAYAADAVLHRTLDQELAPAELPPDGLLLTDWLAEQLALKPGDLVTVRVLEQAQPVLELSLAATVREFVGASAYMRIDALNRALGEAGSLSGAYLLAEPDRRDELLSRLDQRPGVAASNLRQASIESFERTMGENILVFAMINTLLASVVAFGVTYNTARLALAERARELASLRVLGYRRIEIAWVLLGELALLTLAAIPLGLWLGYGFARWIGGAMASEFYRLPTVIRPDSYAFAAAVVLLAMIVSALAIARRLYHLDLVEVLKTRE
jgi:putative ABC transport system permease protein